MSKRKQKTASSKLFDLPDADMVNLDAGTPARISGHTLAFYSQASYEAYAAQINQEAAVSTRRRLAYYERQIANGFAWYQPQVDSTRAFLKALERQAHD